MSSVNKVILVGRLGKDPEVRYAPDGDAIANVSLATSYKRSGEEDATEWHRVVAFKRTAEIMGEYLHKGDLIYIEGFLRTRKWQNKEGVDQYTTEVVTTNLQMLASKNREGGDAGQRESRPAPERRPPQNKGSGKSPGGLADMDDDIPF